MSDVGRKEVDILRLGFEVILLEAVAHHRQIRANCFRTKIRAKNANSSNIFSVR
jgi:hypothetical protein